VTTDAERVALNRELDDYLAATTELRASLLEVQNRIRRMKGLIEEGAETGAILSSFSDPGAVSRGLTEHIDTLELARRRTRRQIVLMGRSEGLSLQQLGNFWGVSRQLISRYLNDEPHRDNRPEP
jgi:hypothetical protein